MAERSLACSSHVEIQSTSLFEHRPPIGIAIGHSVHSLCIMGFLILLPYWSSLARPAKASATTDEFGRTSAPPLSTEVARTPSSAKAWQHAP